MKTIENDSSSYQRISTLISDLEARIESQDLEIAFLKRKTTAIAFAAGLMSEDSANFYSPEDLKNLISEFDLTPQCVLMTADSETTVFQLYEETIKRGFLTTSDVMKMLSYSRPGAIRIMRQTANLHSDLVFAKRKIRNNSARRVWILEHVEHMATVAVKGFGFA